MKKPDSLRQAIQTALPELAADPDRLRLYIGSGDVQGNKGTLSYKTAYTLTVFIQEFARDPAYLNIAVLDWLQRNQPDILGPHNQPAKPFTFEAEPIESDMWDIVIELKLTENVIVRQDENGRLNFQTIAEPQYDSDRVLGRFAETLGVENDKPINRKDAA